MPELPEVETICDDLRKKIINKKIVTVIVKKKNLIRNSILQFKKRIINSRIVNISRRGKLIIISLSGDNNLLIHLKMTGQLIYKLKENITAGGHGLPSPEQGMPNKYSHIIFTFSDNSQLFFNDMRQFGYMVVVNENELYNILNNNYGIEPGLPNFTLDNWLNILSNRMTTIKALLLNQKVIAGIGNIYADEICHNAGIRPQRKVNKLTIVEKKRLWRSAKYIIKKAIKKEALLFQIM